MDNIKKRKTKQYIFENENINSFYRKGKFKTLQGSSKFQYRFATFINDLNISDEELVCHICGMQKKDVKFGL